MSVMSDADYQQNRSILMSALEQCVSNNSAGPGSQAREKLVARAESYFEEALDMGMDEDNENFPARPFWMPKIREERVRVSEYLAEFGKLFGLESPKDAYLRTRQDIISTLEACNSGLRALRLQSEHPNHGIIIYELKERAKNAVAGGIKANMGFDHQVVTLRRPGQEDIEISVSDYLRSNEAKYVGTPLRH